MVLDACLVERRGDDVALLVGDADRRVRAGASGRVEREACRTQVGHQGVSLGGDHAGAKDPLVEVGGFDGLGALEGDVVDSRHGTAVPVRGRFYYPHGR